jgi:uncharacterized protein with GYD domain
MHPNLISILGMPIAIIIFIMPHYILLTRLYPDAVKQPENFEELNRAVTEEIQRECPEVNWVANFLVLGPYDYLDIFEAPNNEVAAKIAVIIRTFGHGNTEIWPAVAWERFRQIALSLVA